MDLRAPTATIVVTAEHSPASPRAGHPLVAEALVRILYPGCERPSWGIGAAGFRRSERGRKV